MKTLHSQQLAPGWWVAALICSGIIFGILCGAFAYAHHDKRMFIMLVPFASIFILVIILKLKNWS